MTVPDGYTAFPRSTIYRHGAKAILVENPYWVDRLWVPESIIHDDSELYFACKDGEVGRLIVPDWFVTKNVRMK